MSLGLTYDVVTVDIDYSDIMCSEDVITAKLCRYRSLAKKMVVCYTAKGIHIYIHLRTPVDFWGLIAIRTDLCDDKDRINADIRRYYKGAHRFINTLFNSKVEYVLNDRGVKKLIHKSRELCFEL